MASEPDPDVLARFVHGDRDAFEAVFRRFESDVFRWIVRIVRDRDGAEDALVETFWRAYRARAQFDPSRSFGAWIRRIASNAALDQLRSQRRHDAVAPVPDHVAAPAGLDPGLHEAIVSAFDHLSPKLRIIATLALIEQRPHADIADALGVPIGTVKSRLHRALQSLRDELTRLGVDQ